MPIDSKPKALLIFHRDLRLSDNTALNEANRRGYRVIPCFIFDDRQVTVNPYRSDNALQFMIESLQDLNQRLHERGSRLHLFSGRTELIVDQLLEQTKAEAVYVNRDYTPFSQQRDAAVAQCCKLRAIRFAQYSDALLHEPGTVLTKQDKPYTVFTAFHRTALKIPVRRPEHDRSLSFATVRAIDERATEVFSEILPQQNAELAVRGGRTTGLNLLAELPRFADYALNRDFPARAATTNLSAHLKFGTVSAREVYYSIISSLGSAHPLVAQLQWRDFFTHIAAFFPHVFGTPFQARFANLVWDQRPEHFACWCKGQTGFPIVDAGMKQLNQTGFMHNRVRMIVASFLTKDLHLDWRDGERYFAQHLVDYDPSVNNGNWQWAASTGCDAQPYFRIFNPWLQQQKFDPEGLYIKRWVPVLQSLSPKEIHDPRNAAARIAEGYPPPLIDHAIESVNAKQRYAVHTRAGARVQAP